MALPNNGRIVWSGSCVFQKGERERADDDDGEGEAEDVYGRLSVGLLLLLRLGVAVAGRAEEERGEKSEKAGA